MAREAGTKTGPGVSRRDLIRRGMVVGGVVWATPVVQVVTMGPAGAETGSPPPGPCPAGQQLTIVRGAVKYDIGASAWVAAGPKDLACMSGEEDNSGVADVVALMNSVGVPSYSGSSPTTVTVLLPEDADAVASAMSYKAAKTNCITDGITQDGRVITFTAADKYAISNIKLYLTAVICK